MSGRPGPRRRLRGRDEQPEPRRPARVAAAAAGLFPRDLLLGLRLRLRLDLRLRRRRDLRLDLRLRLRLERGLVGHIVGDRDHLQFGQALRHVRPEVAGAVGERNDGDAGLVVELLVADPHPVAQAVAGGIGERNARSVHARPRRLPAHGEPRRAADAQDGPRLVRQGPAAGCIDADAAAADLRDEAIECGGHRPPQMSSSIPSSAHTTRGSVTRARLASMLSFIWVRSRRLAPSRSMLADRVFQLR